MNYLQKHQPFQTKKELNETLAAHIARCRFELNETDRDILMMLSRYAVKYPGVAHLKLDTISKTVNKSSRTIQRSIRKLEQFNIIKTQPFMRQKTGGFGANLYIFLPPSVMSEVSPRSNTQKPTATTTDTSHSETEPISLISKKDLYSHNTYEPTLATHYQTFKKRIQSFLGDAAQKTISKLYGIYRVLSIRLLKFDIHKDKEKLFEILSLQALNITFQSTKKKNIRNLYGYYDGVYRKLIDKVVFKDAFMDYDVKMGVEVGWICE